MRVTCGATAPQVTLIDLAGLNNRQIATKGFDAHCRSLLKSRWSTLWNRLHLGFDVHDYEIQHVTWTPTRREIFD